MLDNILKSIKVGRGSHAYCLVGSNDSTLVGYKQITTLLEIPQSEQWQAESTPVTIEQIRLLEKSLNRKPLNGKFKSAYIDLNDIRIEAITAMLKTLEEPPEHSIVVLASTSTQTLLPTIKSRCQVVYVGGDKQNFEFKQNNLSIESFLQLEEELKTKPAEDILDNWIRSLASQVQKDNNAAKIKRLLGYKSMAKTNVNSRLLLENALLSME